MASIVYFVYLNKVGEATINYIGIYVNIDRSSVFLFEFAVLFRFLMRNVLNVPLQEIQNI